MRKLENTIPAPTHAEAEDHRENRHGGEDDGHHAARSGRYPMRAAASQALRSSLRSASFCMGTPVSFESRTESPSAMRRWPFSSFLICPPEQPTSFPSSSTDRGRDPSRIGCRSGPRERLQSRRAAPALAFDMAGTMDPFWVSVKAHFGPNLPGPKLGRVRAKLSPR